MGMRGRAWVREAEHGYERQSIGTGGGRAWAWEAEHGYGTRGRAWAQEAEHERQSMGMV